MKFRTALLALGCVVALQVTALAAMDRHPELKSRPFAWTEYDGSYIVDTNSRAEMLDLWWTVFARPIPKVEWTGSLDPQVAGTISEQFRLRNYSQLNAYRALNYSPAMHEDETFVPLVQEGALVIALNPDKPVTHTIDSSWFGYTEFRALALNTSLLNGYNPVPGSADSVNDRLMGTALDSFIIDPGDWNAGLVGHRAKLLHDANITGTLGQAYSPVRNFYGAVWHTEMQSNMDAAPDNFIAWPAPGYCPFGFFRNAYTASEFRWSFQLTSDNISGLWAQAATVTAKINGVPTPVRNVVRNIGSWTITWEFDPARKTKLELYDAKEVKFGENTGWKQHQDWRLIQSLDMAPLQDEAGMVATLWPGKYTAMLSDDSGANGVGMVEVFAIDSLSESKISNLSTRGVVGSEEKAMIAGFILNEPRTVAIRTQGPGLAQYGVGSPVMDTKLVLTQADGTPVAENDDWQTDPRNARLATDLKGFAPSDPREAALVITLPAGGYTALVSGKTNSGVGIVEVFDLGQ